MGVCYTDGKGLAAIGMLFLHYSVAILGAGTIEGRSWVCQHGCKV